MKSVPLQQGSYWINNRDIQEGHLRKTANKLNPSFEMEECFYWRKLYNKQVFLALSLLHPFTRQKSCGLLTSMLSKMNSALIC